MRKIRKTGHFPGGLAFFIQILDKALVSFISNGRIVVVIIANVNLHWPTFQNLRFSFQRFPHDHIP